MAFPPKEGVITKVYIDRQIGIENKIFDIVDEKAPEIRDLALKIDEIVEYRVLVQGPNKGKVHYVARKQKQATVAAPPKEPKTEAGIFEGRSGQHISLKQGDMIHIFDADMDLLKKLSQPMCPIQKGVEGILKLVDAGGKWVAKDFTPAEGGFKTGKELLQENIDKLHQEQAQTPVEKALANPNPSSEPEPCEFISDKEIQDIHKKAKKPVESKKPEPKAEPTKEPEKVPQNESVKVPDMEKEDGIAKIVRETKERKEAAQVQELEQMTSAMVPVTDKPMVFGQDAINLIKAMVAREAKDSEFALFMYLASQYHLDPLKRQIWLIKYGENPASIFTGRDGFLQIAHRSGHFDGMETTVREEFEDPEKKTKESRYYIATCKVYRNDMTRPFIVEVDSREYDTKKANWVKMPRTMIAKVSESQCLRKAFSVSGLYSPEEMGQ